MSGAFGLFVLFLIIVAAAMLVTSQNRRVDMKLPMITSEATIVDKRAHLWRSRKGSTTEYFVTFELPDTTRVELGVDPVASGQLLVGDYGTVSWSGRTLRSFQRQLLR